MLPVLARRRTVGRLVAESKSERRGKGQHATPGLAEPYEVRWDAVVGKPMNSGFSFYCCLTGQEIALN